MPEICYPAYRTKAFINGFKGFGYPTEAFWYDKQHLIGKFNPSTPERYPRIIS
jgi:hypothetical protein